ncbi:hypothetical protein BJX64DRAFT_282785 [Aspergillus heterothallicus]
MGGITLYDLPCAEVVVTKPFGQRRFDTPSIPRGVKYYKREVSLYSDIYHPDNITLHQSSRPTITHYTPLTNSILISVQQKTLRRIMAQNISIVISEPVNFSQMVNVTAQSTRPDLTGWWYCCHCKTLVNPSLGETELQLLQL